jgi:hypothetical protein
MHKVIILQDLVLRLLGLFNFLKDLKMILINFGYIAKNEFEEIESKEVQILN